MAAFETFSAQLWEEAKRFLEKAKEAKDLDSKEAYLHSSILTGMSALEAYINSICEELLTYPDISLLEKSILSERQIEFDSGEFKIGDKLQIYRLTDRIEFLFYKFSLHKIKGNVDLWYNNLKSSLKLRNGLVHPKQEIKVTEDNTKLLLESIKTCLEEMSKCIYKKRFPFLDLGLQSKLTF